MGFAALSWLRNRNLQNIGLDLSQRMNDQNLQIRLRISISDDCILLRPRIPKCVTESEVYDSACSIQS